MFPFPLSLCLLAIEQDKVQPLSSNGPDLTRYLTVCGILLLSILALAWGFKKLVGNAVRARASSRSLQIVDLLPLGGKQRLAVVRCYDRTFALGLGRRKSPWSRRSIPCTPRRQSPAKRARPTNTPFSRHFRRRASAGTDAR